LLNAASSDLRDLSGLEQLRALFPSTTPPPGEWMGATLGFDYVEVGEGRVVFGATPHERFYNRIGTMHGGFAASLLDSAAGCAVHSKLNPGQSYSTVELKVSFLRPITASTGAIRAEGRAIQVGRRMAFGEASLMDARGQVLATASTTCAVFSK
jgi:uncharacterized protein (TIGR00369 family)